MTYRRIARESALQILFYSDISSYDTITNLNLFCETFPLEKKSKQFFQRLVNGVWNHNKNINYIIEKHSSNWKISRMSCVDRNILRFATFEIIYCEDIPSKVSINEAIDIGKKYGTLNSGAFINAILDSIHLSLTTSKETK